MPGADLRGMIDLRSLELLWCLECGAWVFLRWGFHSIVAISAGFDFAIEVMKAIIMILSACAALALPGCATQQGGTTDEYNTNWGVGTNPASPTFRPGMYPNDIRDPNALTRPLEPPHTTPP
jgi:hypothetical protein